MLILFHIAGFSALCQQSLSMLDHFLILNTLFTTQIGGKKHAFGIELKKNIIINHRLLRTAVLAVVFQ